MALLIDKNLKKRWGQFSLIEQLANIGSELNRALRWEGENPQLFESAIYRTLELLDLTISDWRWRKRLKELTRLREIICDTVWGEKEYQTSLADLERYFFYFALADRLHK